jgi:hypothetical protein
MHLLEICVRGKGGAVQTSGMVGSMYYWSTGIDTYHRYLCNQWQQHMHGRMAPWCSVAEHAGLN